jgi:hypothetical protein
MHAHFFTFSHAEPASRNVGVACRRYEKESHRARRTGHPLHWLGSSMQGFALRSITGTVKSNPGVLAADG